MILSCFCLQAVHANHCCHSDRYLCCDPVQLQVLVFDDAHVQLQAVLVVTMLKLVFMVLC